jgi:hypothetical protein
MNSLGQPGEFIPCEDIAMLHPKQIGRVVTHPNYVAGVSVWTPPANTSLEHVRSMVFQQTTAGATVDIGVPLDASLVFSVDLVNIGTAAVTVRSNGQTVSVQPSATLRITWRTDRFYKASEPPVIGGNAPFGYYDVGPMRMQWGTFQYSSGTNQYGLPAAFANTNYTIVGTPKADNINYVIVAHCQPLTTTMFTGICMYQNGASAAQNYGQVVNFIAMGLKP